MKKTGILLVLVLLTVLTLVVGCTKSPSPTTTITAPPTTVTSTATATATAAPREVLIIGTAAVGTIGYDLGVAIVKALAPDINASVLPQSGAGAWLEILNRGNRRAAGVELAPGRAGRGEGA